MSCSNNFKLFEYKSNKEEHVKLKKTQQKLKEYDSGELALNMLNAATEAMMSNLPVVSHICKTVDDWLICSPKNNKGDVKMNSDNVLKFIEVLKKQEDFIKAYVFEENNETNIWVVTEEIQLEQKLNYMRLYREHEDSDNFSIMLFEEDEEEGILEQISYITEFYKEVINDGK